MNRKFNITYFADNYEKIPVMSIAMWIKIKIIMVQGKKVYYHIKQC